MTLVTSTVNRGFAIWLMFLLLTSCKGKNDRAPAADSEFQVRVQWSGKPVPQHSLRSIMTYCSTHSRNSGCVDLDNGRPTAAFVTRESHVVFFDHRAGLVEFDSAGRFIANIGSLGNDPGSYRNVAALGADSAGRVTLWDPELNRLTVFRSNELIRYAWVRDELLESLLIADTLAVALTIPQSKNQGDRVFAKIAPLTEKGRLGDPIAVVSALATTDQKWKMRSVVPNFYWPRPLWGLGEDRSVAYVPPDTVLRLEFYDEHGHPKMLVTGVTPFPGEPVTEKELSRLRARLYEEVVGEPMLPGEACSTALSKNHGNANESMDCLMFRYVHAVGKRSPRLQPPVTDIVSFAPHGFWVRTSRIRQGKATWLIADSTGKLVASVDLKAEERPIGRHGQLFAIADATDGRISVSWRELIK